MPLDRQTTRLVKVAKLYNSGAGYINDSYDCLDGWGSRHFKAALDDYVEANRHQAETPEIAFARLTKSAGEARDLLVAQRTLADREAAAQIKADQDALRDALTEKPVAKTHQDDEITALEKVLDALAANEAKERGISKEQAFALVLGKPQGARLHSQIRELREERARQAGA